LITPFKYLTRKLLFILLFCIFPIVFGGLIYLGFRSSSLLMFKWFNFIGFKKIIDNYRFYILPLKDNLPEWFYLSLPDGIWVFSLTTSLIVYWEFDYTSVKIWLLFPLILGIAVEILQYFFIFPGTFDILDLILSIIGFTLSLIFLIKKSKHYECEK
jgi:hypothetical protein